MLALVSFAPAEIKSTPTATATGTGAVSFVDKKRGYGFIFGDDKEPKVLVHLSAVRKAEFETLEKGQRSVFEIAPDEIDRPRAINFPNRPGA